MNLEQFFVAFKKAAPEFSWELKGCLLRGQLKGGFGLLNGYCPVTAVCRSLKGEDHSLAYSAAGKSLGLRGRLAIENAADGNPKYLGVRKRLLAIVGLTE